MCRQTITEQETRKENIFYNKRTSAVLQLLVTYLGTGSVSAAVRGCLSSEKGKQPAAPSWPNNTARAFRRISPNAVRELVQVPLKSIVRGTVSLLTLSVPVCLQHFAVLLKYFIHVAIPDIPTWVREEMAKLDYQRREAFKVSFATIKDARQR